ncbi:hypothetical protein JTE88_05930 [Arcanobacterium phocisimile]|uniref:ABC-2 family transporter protein n=1 Tax=Arcanobacterium phocisimile TaxID=1302235 RepID=A0ABX7IET0_9ACTO|nr:hypothetical protein [Arcanobacterium phocisimile]QRV01641.1 hypothetical protein JTE88_05930 [Arcanobacterium phocisimile]
MFLLLLRQEFTSQKSWLSSIFLTASLIAIVSFVVSLPHIPGLTAFPYFTMVATAIGTPVVIMIGLGAEYWQSMSGERGYFTHTIPAKPSELFWAKTLFAFLVELRALGLTMLVLLALALSNAWENDMSLGQFLEPYKEYLQSKPTWLVVVALLYFTLGLASIILQGAAVLSISALGRFTGSRASNIAIGFAGLYLANQVLGAIGTLLIPISVRISDLTLTWEPMLPSIVRSIQTDSQPELFGIGLLITLPILTIVLIWFGIRAIARTSLR